MMKHMVQLKAVITSIYIQIRYSERCKMWGPMPQWIL